MKSVHLDLERFVSHCLQFLLHAVPYT